MKNKVIMLLVIAGTARYRDCKQDVSNLIKPKRIHNFKPEVGQTCFSAESGYFKVPMTQD